MSKPKFILNRPATFRPQLICNFSSLIYARFVNYLVKYQMLANRIYRDRTSTEYINAIVDGIYRLSPSSRRAFPTFQINIKKAEVSKNFDMAHVGQQFPQ
jgi:hypothetical protein